MKYKDVKLELPPLGKYVCICNDEENVDYGFFYIRRGERHFQTCSRMYMGFISDEFYWAIMPDFKDPKKELPEVGHSVLACCIDEETSFRDYWCVILLEGMDKLVVNGEEIDGWIELEALDKD